MPPEMETVQALRARGVLSPALEEALEAVPRPTADVLAPLEPTPALVAVSWPPDRPGLVPGPGVVGLMLHLAGDPEDVRVHVVGHPWVLDVLEAMGHDAADEADLVLVLEGPLDEGLDHVAEGGLCVQLQWRGRGRVAVHNRGPIAIGTRPDEDQLRLLALEGVQQSLLLGRPNGLARDLWSAARDIYAPPAGERQVRAAAFRVFTLGYAALALGDTLGAALAFRASGEVLPSSEALTFEGWARSQEGLLDVAIELCKEAIELDPSLGNPYNDIGVYLLDLNRPDEALDWFERARTAERYSNPWYPVLNLARAHLALGARRKARSYLEEAARMAPDEDAVEKLRRRLGDA